MKIETLTKNVTQMIKEATVDLDNGQYSEFMEYLSDWARNESEQSSFDNYLLRADEYGNTL